MSKRSRFIDASRKLLLLLRKAALIRKHAYILTILQFVIAIIFTFQIRLLFEPEALHSEDYEYARMWTILRGMPKDVKCRYMPDNKFVRRLMSRAALLLNTKIYPATQGETHERNSSVASLWAIFNISEEQSDKPMVLEYTIRSYDFDDSIFAIWNDEEPSREDPYMTTGFIPLQIAIDISFIGMWKRGQLNHLIKNVWIGRFPYHTLNLLVMPMLLQPSITVAYYLMIIAFALIPVEVLHKVVHDKDRGFRELMHVMGMSLATLYTGWIIYMLLVAIPVAIACTIVLDPILDAYAPTISVFILSYLIMSTCFMFFVGFFFDNSVKASVVSIVIWSLLSHASIKLSEYTENMSYLIQIATLCLPHNGLLYGLLNFAMEQDMIRSANNHTGTTRSATRSRSDLGFYSTLEKSLEAVNVSNLFGNKSEINLGIILLSWALHVTFWMSLTLYADNLWPGRHGSARQWYHPCQRCVSKPLEIDANHRGTTKWSTVERIPIGLMPVISIRKLTKKFGSPKNQVIAISNMTIDFYEGGFHIILGHNGAGKSTLLKMIVGMYKPSQGHIHILGRDYDTRKESKKNLIGYCPQDNILVNDLTAVEHVYIFGMLKDMSYKEALEKAELMLTQLGLGADKNKKVKNFSLGMKRRVCLSMALIGNAKILVLDEPGYGVDPLNRRKIWDTLLAFREQRTILMTTNSMEAADILPDRIAIIANGKVECYGTKMYLNRRFGAGYILSLIVEEDCDRNFLTVAIQNFSPDQIKLRSTLGSVIKYDLPRRTAFTKLLRHLEHNVRALKIKSIGLNVASIEEQFRRIGSINHIKARRGINTFYTDHEFEMKFRTRRRDLLARAKTWTRRKGQQLYAQQMFIMFYKKCLHILSLRNVYGYSLLFSLVAFLACLAMAKQVHLSIVTSRVNEVNISKYTALGLGILLHGDEKSQTLLDTLINTSKSCDFHEPESYCDVSYDISATKLITKPTWNSVETRKRYFMTVDVFQRNRVMLIYSVTASHSGPISINFLHNALLRYNGCEDCAIEMKTEPVLDPAEWHSRIIDAPGLRNWQNFSIVVTLFLLLPSINLVTKEFRSSSKQLQLNTTGMSFVKYWVPIYIVDILIYIICLLSILSVTPILYVVKYDTTIIEIVQLLFIFLLYGIAALPMGYILHFFGSRVEISCIIVIVLNTIILTFINGSITNPMLTQVVQTSGRKAAKILFHMFPQYVLACAVGSFLSIHIFNAQCTNTNTCQSAFWSEDPCCQPCGDKGCYEPRNIMWSSLSGAHEFGHSIMVDVCIFMADTILFMIIIMFAESRWKLRIGRYLERLMYPDKIPEHLSEPYVSFETEQVDDVTNGSKSSNTVSSGVMLSIQRLSKKICGETVVQGIDFNVYRKECLGLLGVSGAGKSIIFKMLSGELFPTSGKAFIQENNLVKDRHSFSSMVGYCPQIRGLNKFMTARQNLRLHATLRGVPLERVQDEVDKWLDVFDLLDYENMRVKDCPWGIKRKICILQSLIGDLPIVLLDEPTSGLDAIARQVVCDTLHFVRERGTSLLVTTQSMAAAENICSRIGVLVNGQLVAFGSSEQLKHRHGEYFTLKIVMPVATSLEKIEQVKESVAAMFTGFHFESLHAGTLKYEISTDATSYSRIFERLERLKAKYPEISDSSVSQTTMEHVFLSLCDRYQDTKTPREKPICVRKIINKIHRV